MKKVLVLGSTGMLGHQVVEYFKKFPEYKTTNISFKNKYDSSTIILDIKNKEKVRDLIIKINPDYIINCIGVLISGSNKDYENAVYINAYFPHQLAKLSNQIDCKLVHISTDCVFSGEKGKYIETDFKDGKDLYSKSKALGEIVDNRNLTIRTSIIGPEIKENGEGLFHWFMNQDDSIEGYTKSIWSGVTTLELAKAIKWGIENDIVGLYHLTNNKSINKYELLTLFKSATKKEIMIKSVQGKEVDKSFIDTRRLLSYEIPDYEDMVIQMVGDIKKNNHRYGYFKKV